MKKKSFLAVALVLTLVFGACGTANNSNTVLNTETEIGTELVHETETELVTTNTETVDVETDVTESAETTESEFTEKTEKASETTSDTKTDDTKTNTSKNNDSSKNESSSNNSSSGNTNNSDSNTGTGSNSSGSSNSGSNSSGSTSSGSSNSGNTSNSESNESEPTPAACSHTNTGIWGGNGSTHDIICDDCFMNKGEVIVLRSETCNLVNGFCTGCGVNCPHSSVSWDSSSSQSGHCNMICNICGIVYNNVHAISWKGNGHSCSRCGAFWSCEHTYTAIRGSGSASHDWYCTGCGAYLSTEPHSFANGSCTACGWADPSYVAPEATSVNEDALPEESVEVTP